MYTLSQQDETKHEDMAENKNLEIALEISENVDLDNKEEIQKING